MDPNLSRNEFLQEDGYHDSTEEDNIDVRLGKLELKTMSQKQRDDFMASIRAYDAKCEAYRKGNI